MSDWQFWFMLAAIYASPGLLAPLRGSVALGATIAGLLSLTLGAP